MKNLLTIILAAAAVQASAITATKAYVDNATNATRVAVRGEIATATNATLAAANAYTDAAIQGGGAVTPSIVTNIAGRVTSNVVTKSYVEGLGISAGLTTNDVQSIVSERREKTDLNVYTNVSYGSWVKIDGEFYLPMEDQPVYTVNGWEWHPAYDPYDYGASADGDENSTYLEFKYDVFQTKFKACRRAVSAIDESRTLVDSSQLLSATNAVMSYAYPAASGNQLASQVATIGAHLNAEDARFVSTNYNSVTHMPEAYVEIKLPDNSWSVVWREMTRWNWMTNSYLPTNYASKAELDQKADRAWGYYDSHTGNYAPDGYTWISSPRIAIAADLAYQRTVTSEGAIWVLESSGVVTQTGGTTNGYFRISDDEQHTLFEIVKGNKRTIGADASSCQVVSGFTPTKLQIGYSIQADSHPTIEVCTNLTDNAWKAETDADCYANVSWSGSSGAYVAQVQGKANYQSLFVKATYEAGGESYVRNVAPVSMTHLYIGGAKYAVGTATISGHTVLTLTPAN